MRAMTEPPCPITAPKWSVGTMSLVVLLAPGRNMRSSSISWSTWMSSRRGAPAISRMASCGLNGGTSASFTDTFANSRSLFILLPRLPMTQAVSSLANRRFTAIPLPGPRARGTKSTAAVGPSRMSKCLSLNTPNFVSSTMSSCTLKTADSKFFIVGPVIRSRFCSVRPLTGSRTMCQSQLVSSMRAPIRAPFSPMRCEQLTSGIMTSTARWCWSSQLAAPPAPPSKTDRMMPETAAWMAS
mmetsp:Transcript_4400/g.10664  ORF Transcript_4400/g.10664 Transcript_4400/m.10664 type:complete len:241 (+) Transcript_4400:1417-2139(+)